MRFYIGGIATGRARNCDCKGSKGMPDKKLLILGMELQGKGALHDVLTHNTLLRSPGPTAAYATKAKRQIMRHAAFVP